MLLSNFIGKPLTMLVEIFRKMGDELKDHIIQSTSKTKKVAIVIGPEKKKSKNPSISIELLRFGFDTNHKNYQAAPTTGKAAYSFSFYILVRDNDSESTLELTELVCDHFDRKPFIQWKSKEKEFEMSLSILELSVNELNQFWMAQKQAHRPVLFYQARVSEI